MQYVIDLVLCAIFGITIAVSVKKGFFYTLFELFGYIISFVSAKLFSEAIAPSVYSAVLEKPITDKVAEALGETGTMGYTEAIEGFFEKIPLWATGIAESIGISKESLIENVNAADLQGSNAVETVMNKIVSPIGISVIQVVVFAISVIAFMFVLKVVIRLLNKIIKKLPVIKGFNKALGGVLGAAKGAIIVVIVAFIMLAVSGATGSEEFVDAVNNSFIASSVKEILTEISGYQI